MAEKRDNKGRGIHTVLFDLDNTLYPYSSGVSEAADVRIDEYMMNKLNLSKEETAKKRSQYKQKFGMTIKGLMQDHNVDPFPFFEYVHGGLNIEERIKPNQELRKLLLRMKPGIKKWVFSNSDKTHCTRVLKTLDIVELFDGIFDVLLMLDTFKPHPTSFDLVLSHTGAQDFKGCLFLDDRIENLVSAKEKGMTTVLVGAFAGIKQHPQVDYCVDDILQFSEFFQEIFNKE